MVGDEDTRKLLPRRQLLRFSALALAAAGGASLMSCAAPAAPPSPTPAPPAAPPAAAAAPTAPAPAAPAPAPAAAAAPAASPAAPPAASPAAAAKAPSGQTDTVTFTLVTHGIQYVPLYVAQAKGLLKAENIELDLVITNSSPTSLQGLIARSYHLGPVSSDTLLVALSQAKIDNLRFVASVATLAPYILVAQPQIQRLQDLRGKTIGASALKTADAYFLAYVLAQNGLKPEDYTLTFIGGNPERIAAVDAGKVDAVMLFEPWVTQLVERGKVKLASLTDYIKDWEFLDFVAETGWLRSHEDTLVRFLRAYIKAIDYVYDPANKQEVVDIFTQAAKSSPKASQAGYDSFVEQYKVIPRNAEINQKGLAAVLASLKANDQLGPNPIDLPSLLDLSALQKAKASLGR
ncbi:MAG: ABC transporter substrate-binding protein [Chloroflexi bacterium]|nr:ABC transporter substrate-binding protein [Chloroflexota bacterium]